MRRLPLIAATAALAAGTTIGVVESATAAKPPSFTLKSVLVAPSEVPDRCVITLDWEVSDPSAVESYLVQANNSPLRGKDTVQGNVITETTATWEVDTGSAFYTKVTINLVGGKSSKSWSVAEDTWTC